MDCDFMVKILRQLNSGCTVDAIMDFEWGTSASDDGRNNGFTHCVFMTFKDKAGLETYLPHPAHVAFKETSLPVIEKLMVIDYIAKD